MRFKIEYAKRGTAGCKFTTCKKKIDKGLVRIARVSKSPFAEDAELLHWFHPGCLFDQMKGGRATKMETLDELEGFEEIEDKDKEHIKKLFEEYLAADTKTKSTPKPKKSEKRKADKNEDTDGDDTEDKAPLVKKPKKEDKKKRKKKKKEVSSESE